MLQPPSTGILGAGDIGGLAGAEEEHRTDAVLRKAGPPGGYARLDRPAKVRVAIASGHPFGLDRTWRDDVHGHAAVRDVACQRADRGGLCGLDRGIGEGLGPRAGGENAADGDHATPAALLHRGH